MADHDETLGEFDTPSWTEDTAAAPAVSATGRDPNLGRSIGPYRIERLIARGGMGAVYLATRQFDFEQRVALKLVRPQWRDVDVLRRFAAERQILARLEHPNIARILDGGTTDDALPFFVMEYVEGLPVDRYCNDHALSLRQKLALFRRICTAVHFAHQNLVVHRDLKPQNILVTQEGIPKLLDFGIAKILEPGANAPQGSQPGTPSFASPEQLLGQAVTTASDVYSLGLILHLLVTGTLPKRSLRLLLKSLSEHKNGPEENLAFDGKLAADLEAIILKALSLNPAVRYGSALRLAEDVDHFLKNRPVKAHQGSWFYRLRKLALPYKAGLVATLLVLGFAITTSILWRSAVEQRQQARAAQQRSERVADFLGDIFKLANPDATRGEAITLREALDQGREKIASEWLDDNEIRAELLTTLGTVYNNLGLYRDAKGLKEEALRARRAADPTDRSDLAADLNNLGRLHYDLGEFERAEIYFLQALEMWQRLADEPHVALASSNLASTFTQRGEYEKALQLHRRTLELHQQLYGPEHRKVAASLYGLGALHRIRGEPQKAEPFLRQALDIYTRDLGSEHTKVASVESSLGRVLQAQGHLLEAKEHLRRVLDLRRQLLGPDHRQVAGSERNLAALMLEMGEIEAAGPLLESALKTLRTTTPIAPAVLAETEGVWGSYQSAQGAFATAEPSLLKSYKTLSRIKGQHHADTHQALNRLVKLYEAWGNEQEAARYRAASSPR